MKQHKIFALIGILLTIISCQTPPTPKVTVTSNVTVTLTFAPTATAMPIKNPFSAEENTALAKGGYIFSPEGTLKDRIRRVVLTFDGHSWKTADDAEYDKTELHVVAAIGVDFFGKDIGAILVIEKDQEKLIFLPPTGKWVKPIDIATFQKIMDQNPVPTAGAWGSYENVQFADIPEVPWGADKSGQIFYSAQLALRSWPEKVRVPTLQYIKYNSGNTWMLTEYPTVSMEDNIFLYDITVARPILAENDGVRNLGAVKMRDPYTGEWVVIKLQQYLYEENTVVLQIPFRGESANPESVEFSLTQKSLSNPPWVITMPIVSDASIRGFLPLALQQLMAKLDNLPSQMSREQPTFLVGDEIYKMQKIVFENFATQAHFLQLYLRPEDDPFFDKLYHPK